MAKYNTILKRILASIIDGILLYPISFLESLYIHKGVIAFGMITLAVAFIYIFYFILLHAKYGYTIGKKIVGLRVLDISESRLISFKQSMLREIPFFGTTFIVLFYTVVVFDADLLTTKETFYEYTAVVNLIWIGADFIYALSNKKRRAIHDVIANSVVIKSKI